MAERKIERKLAAILAADVVGYARLIGEDEAGTLAAMKAHRRELWTPLTDRHGGRIVGTAGDSILVEFASAVAAVECAVAVQQGLAERSTEMPEDRRMLLRIGVNIGEVVVDEADIHGDGVNIAARLEELAEPGGLCISDDVHRQVEGKTELVFADAGAHEVKNIARALHVWRWRPEAGAPAAEAGAEALALPDKPSIAVLPFTNMSGDQEQEFFADGISEDIITALSRMPWFFVIARNSTFTYKGKAVDVTEVAHDLGVQYVLEGSVRKAGDRLRITAQLIDATTGKHVWAERYDRQLADVFAVQDEVTESIVGAVAPEFLSVEARRAQRKDPERLDAWECVVRGRAHLWRMGREDLAQARRLFQRAIELAPSGEFGASDLALAHLLESLYGWTDSPARSFDETVRAARMAVAADDHDAWAQTTLGVANLFARRWDDALPPVERAIELNPSFAPAYAMRGLILGCLGDPERGIESTHEAIRLSPRDSFMAFWLLGLVFAYYVAERYEEAAETGKRAIRLAPENPSLHRQLAASYAMLGRLEEARAALAQFLRLEPGHTTADVRERVPAKNPEHLERFIEGLRRAGLPD